jgi:hypothetical protein
MPRLLQGLVCLALVAGVPLLAAPLDQWHQRNPVPVQYGAPVTYSNGVYVGTVRLPEEANVNIASIAYGDGRFVGVGGTDTIISTNGSDWSIVRLTNRYDAPNLTGVGFGNGVFVAIGSFRIPGRPPGIGYGIMTSVDGLAWRWTFGTQTFFQRMEDVAYGNGTFVVLRHFGGALASTDGKNWTSATDQLCCPSHQIAFGNGLFVGADDRTISSSPDGLVWTKRADSPSRGITDIGFANGLFGVVGVNGQIVTSSDGIDWSNAVTGTSGLLRTFAGSNISFVVQGDSGESLISPDGRQWTRQGTVSTASLRDIAYGAGAERFAAVGSDYLGGGVWQPDTILTSTDGVTWAAYSSGGRNLLSAITWGNGKFVSVGTKPPPNVENPSSAVVTSSDGIHWTDQPEVPGVVLADVAYGNGIFVAVGSGTATSSDGVNWMPRPSESVNPLQSIAYGNGIFMALTVSNIFISPDGITWTKRPWVEGTVRAVTYGAGLFAVVGQRVQNLCCDVAAGAMWTSADGARWTQAGQVDDIPALNTVAYGNGLFLALAAPYNLAIYAPTRGWTSQRMRPYTSWDISWSTAAYGAGTFVGVGGGGGIIQSDSFSRGILSGPKPSQGGFEVTIAAEIGRHYRLQTSTNPLADDWTDLLDVTPSEPISVVTNTAPASSQRFYRLASP